MNGLEALLRHPAIARAAAALVVALAAAPALAGCSGIGAPTPTPVQTPARPEAFGLATGTETCGTSTAPTISPAPAAPDPEIVNMDCTRTFTDPRLSGVLRQQVHLDVEQPIVKIWGSGTLMNEGGIWVCDVLILGSFSNNVGSRNDVCVGTDGYQGLTAYVQGPTRDQGTTFGLIGWIVETVGAP